MVVVCDVILADAIRAYDNTYSYLARSEDGQSVEAGALVELPFGRGNKIRRAYVRRVYEAVEEAFPKGLKSITAVCSAPVLKEEHFHLAEEMKRRYFCSLSQALSCMAPPAIFAGPERQTRTIGLNDPQLAAQMLENGDFKTIQQERAVQTLLEADEMSLADLLAAATVGRSVIQTLEKNGVVSFRERPYVYEAEKEDIPEVNKEICLTDEQKNALAILNSKTVRESPNGLSEYLLWGITGSGKTELYLRAAEEVLNRGRSVIILVPEISLTPQMSSRIEARFGKNAAILHSRLTPSERFSEWRSLYNGEKRLALGARSCIFAPVDNLGLIVIDEEQESSYKSEQNPRYSAHEIARIRAVRNQAILVLGSATPSVESFNRVESGKSVLLSLTHRPGKAILPVVELCDMRNELSAGNYEPCSRKLKAEMQACFERGEQVILFLNRRGYAGTSLCGDCGQRMLCEDCDISLTEHRNQYGRDEKRLICHYCGKIYNRLDVCPACGSERIIRIGWGTQQLEEWFKENFPDRRALRMDQDSMIGRRAHAELLGRFARGEADCLIGTQMIAKGHDFPKVTLVGIISADLLFTVPDFRADERAFQLITQACGRAGRADHPGKVIIQAFDTVNPTVIDALNQDYGAFYKRESEIRKRLGFPPFGDMAVVLISGPDRSKTESAAFQVEKQIRSALNKAQLSHKVQIFSAAEAPLARLRSRFRFRLILKSADRELLARIGQMLADYPLESEIRLSLDINPYHMG